MSRYAQLVDRLLKSEDPITRLKAAAHVLGQAPKAGARRRLDHEIRGAKVVRELLSERRPDGTIGVAPYTKWNGAHWVLVMLAEVMYPPGDAGLIPLREQVYGWIRGEESSESSRNRFLHGLWRMHASMHGNILFALVNLGLATDVLGRVVADLLEFQWPDGGWNCDKSRKAHKSSFTHTVIALRGLIAYNRGRNDPEIARAIGRAAEIFLARRLLFRLSNGEVIDDDFLKLSYPYYHFYTYLFGLRVMGEGGYLDDPRCAEALDLLESRYVDGAGFKTDRTPYHHSLSKVYRYTPARWEDAKVGVANEYLTTDALIVLKQAGRL
jgi:hypothetical protein